MSVQYVVFHFTQYSPYRFNSRQSFRGKGINDEDPAISARSRMGNSTNGAQRFTGISEMFNPPESSSVTIEITRTIEFDRTIGEPGHVAKGVYSSDNRVRSFSAAWEVC